MDREIVVQKYGGSSVADNEKMLKVAEHIKKTADDGKAVVVVLSARGQTTDELIHLAKEAYGGSLPPEEEIQDEKNKLLATGEEQSAPLLALTLWRLGIKAISLTSREIELETNTAGKVKMVRGIREILSLISQGKVPIVTGYQGIKETTKKVIVLGRGGSDVTAVVLTAVLKARHCENYTDVDGIYTVDPRIVPKAKRFSQIPSYQLAQLTELGGGKLMDRAVILAQNLGVEIRVLLSPSFGQSTGGTLVGRGNIEEMETSLVQSGIAIQKGKLVRISNVSNEPGVAKEIFEALKEFVLMDSVQGLGEKMADISLLCFADDLSQIMTKLNRTRENGTVGEIKISEGLAAAELTLINPLVKEEPGYFYRVFGAMAKAKINIEMYAAAGSAISVIVREDDLKIAAQALAEEFDLVS
jgi:aspartate kinase